MNQWRINIYAVDAFTRIRFDKFYGFGWFDFHKNKIKENL